MRNRTMHGTSNNVGSNHLGNGNFCKLFPDLPTWAEAFAASNEINNMDDRATDIAEALGGPGGIMHDIEDSSGDSSIAAAYTFFAQFVDHDITFDTGSALRGGALTNADIENLPNLRSASLDLDSVYGFGPVGSPYLYELDGSGRLLVGSAVDGVENPNDVPRTTNGVALLGDPRNDENHFLSQLHLLFLRFHNRLLSESQFSTFEAAQQEARYTYQSIVLDDFLRQICDVGIYNFVRENINNGNADAFLLLRNNSSRMCMPVEFSAAAYRFGHTMVRSRYPVNEEFQEIEIFDEEFGTTGLRPGHPELTVDWRFLLEVDPNQEPTPTFSKAIDHLLADELMHLPRPVVDREEGGFDRALAFRNIRRGYVLGLPSGQAVAQAFIESPYPITEPHSISFSQIQGWNSVLRAHPHLDEHTPLFFYLMVEAGQIGGGERLGPVGSAILMDVFGSMLIHAQTSFLNDSNGWNPQNAIISEQGETPTLGDLVRYVEGE